MDAKTYLRQIRDMEIKIYEKRKELDLLRTSNSIMKGIDYSRTRVQSSNTGDFTDEVCRIADLQAEITASMAEFIEKRHIIIGQIENLSDAVYSQILFDKYVLNKRLDDMELAYTNYNSRQRAHTEALKLFQKEYLDNVEEFKNAV